MNRHWREGVGTVYEHTRRPLRFLAAAHGCTVRKTVREEGRAAILFIYQNEGYECFWSSGFFADIRQAVAFSRAVFLTQGVKQAMANVYKDKRLFSHIKGAMVRDKRITVTMDGSYGIVEIGKDSAMAEIGFDDHEKKALLNGNQVLRIAEVYGPESAGWKGKPVVLYAEYGEWFGRKGWGLRVDLEKTKTAAAAAAGQPQKKAQKRQRSNTR